MYFTLITEDLPKTMQFDGSFLHKDDLLLLE